MAILLTCDNLSKSFGPRMLFSGISISFAQDERIGLIGPNGAGKSTLLRILAGLEHTDTGELNSKRNLRMQYVPQEETFTPGQTVEQVMLEALDEEHGAHGEHNDHLEPHERETQVAILLHKIGFDRPEQLVDTLSGGWRKRLAIARKLICEPELLLLDEPTNHLDLEGIAWLEDLLAAASFSCIMVSHDRYFLESAASRIVELSRAYPQGYLSVPGTYSDFVERRAEFMEAQAAEQQAVASRVRREIQWLRRGAKARTTKAKGRIQLGERLMDDLGELKARNAQQQSSTIDFSASGRQTRKLLECKKVSKGLGGRSIVKDLSLVLSPGTKLGLVGPNGSGKTTLIRLLTGDLTPDSGEVKHADALKVVCFDQTREQLDRTKTLRYSLMLGEETGGAGDKVFYRGGSMHISGWAKQFLFDTQQLDLPVAELSGGEQARVLLARLMLRPADVLILDEPTNDLDIATLEVLEESLESFPGALVLVTHDRFMLDRLCTDLVGLDGLGGHGIYGSLLQYQRAVEQADEQAKQAARQPKVVEKKPAGSSPAGKRLSWNEQRELERMEAQIHEAEASAARLQEEMSSPAVMADHVKMAEVCAKSSAADEVVRRLYERWEKLEKKKERE